MGGEGVGRMPTENDTRTLVDAIDGLSEKIGKQYNLEAMASSLSDIARSLSVIADAQAASVLAAYGSEEDRQVVVKELQKRFWGSYVFKDLKGPE